ncbi:MAG TPA: hypothetical protein VJN96_15530 [Vicinamibacterales bacterium]|nr:hypothetical protein [Vicinamibacterales bacterium]
MTTLVLIWLVVASALVFWRWHLSRGLGMFVAFVVSLSSLHFLAATIYVLPWYAGLDRDYIQAGLFIALEGLVALGIGAVLMSLFLQSETAPMPEESDAQPQLALMYLAVGGAMYTVVRSFVADIPSVGAIAAAGSSLVIFGLCLKCWQVSRSRQVLWLLASAVLPFVTILTQGYLSYGIAALVVIFAFVAENARPRWVLIAGGLVVSYITMSFYVTYMRDRNEIRYAVWNGASAAERVSVVGRTLGSIEPFDIRNNAHLSRVDDRLNQDYLVGRAESWLDQRYAPFGHGATLKDAALALVPRVVWRDKPMAAGSGDLVSQYTGIQFGPDTSVGIGEVMELYVNFGSPGVWTGMAVLGALLVLIDERAAFHLANGDVKRCCLWFVPGLSLLQVGGSLVDVSLTAGAGLAGTVFANYAIDMILRAHAARTTVAPPDAFIGQELP